MDGICTETIRFGRLFIMYLLLHNSLIRVKSSKDSILNGFINFLVDFCLIEVFLGSDGKIDIQYPQWKVSTLSHVLQCSSEDPGPFTSSYALLNETPGKKTFQITVTPSIRKKRTPIIIVKHPSHGLNRKFLSTTKPKVSLEINIEPCYIMFTSYLPSESAT